MEFFNDLLTDAGTDRIDFRIVGHNRHLGTVTRITGNGLDLNNALRNLRDFLLKQTLHQHRIPAAHNNLRTLGILVHFRNHDTDPLTLDQPLTGNLRRLGQKSRRLAEVDQRKRRLHRFNNTDRHIVQLIDIGVVDRILLRLPDLLAQNIVGQRNSSARHIVNIDIDLAADLIIEDRITLPLARLFQIHLKLIVLYIFNDVVDLIDVKGAFLRIELHFYINVIESHRLLICLAIGIFQRIDDDVLRNTGFIFNSTEGFR